MSDWTFGPQSELSIRNGVLSGRFAMLKPVFDATAYGAKGDGVTDDTGAIQHAIDAAANGGGVGEGGTVILGPGTFLTGQLVLKHRVWLVGSGFGTILKAKLLAATTYGSALITNWRDANGTAEFCGVTNLRIEGQKSLQTDANAHGIEWFANDAQLPNDEEFDTHHVIQDVFIWRCKGNGFKSTGRSEHRLIGVLAYDCDGRGFEPTYDTFFDSCTAGRCGLSGFHFLWSSVRCVDCKSFGNGVVTASAGNGFHIKSPGVVLSGCEAQDNQANGYSIDGAGDRCVLTGCIADSNNRSAQSFVGFDLFDATFNVICGLSYDRQTTGQDQASALKIRSNSINNIIRVSHSWSTGTPGAPIHSSSDSIVGNDIAVNNQLGLQTPAFSTPFTPDPYAGGIIKITLTGNITINNTTQHHVGQRLTLVLVQDATGTRTTTFGTDYRTSWTPNTAANLVNIIEFVREGTRWVQTNATTGLAAL